MKNAGSQMCGGEFDFDMNQKVIIASPNYPNQYVQNLKCNYLIKVSWLYSENIILVFDKIYEA